MANEITISGSISGTKPGAVESLSVSGLTITMTGTDYVKKTQTIGTSSEALGLIDAGTIGLCLIKNLDTTNYVEVRGRSADLHLLRINAGEFALFRFSGDSTAPEVKANTAACIVEYVIFEA